MPGWNRISEWAGGVVAILVAIAVAICLWLIIFPARWDGCRRRRWGLRHRSGVDQRPDRRVHVPEVAGSNPAPASIFCGDRAYDRRHTCLLPPGHLGLHRHGDHAWEPRRDDEAFGDDLHWPAFMPSPVIEVGRADKTKPLTFKDIPWAGEAPPGWYPERPVWQHGPGCVALSTATTREPQR